MNSCKIAVLGGDARQAWAADALEVFGHCVFCHGVPQRPDGLEQRENTETLAGAMEGAEVVVGPVPFSKCGDTLTHSTQPPIPVDDLLAALRPGQRLIAGSFMPKVLEYCEANSVSTHALLSRKDFAMLNAVPTAEAVIAQAIVRSDINIQHSECLVLGFGCCGRAIARLLQGMGADVVVAVRSWHSVCAAMAAGFQVVELRQLPRVLRTPQFVFNTVPAPILNEELLQLLPGNTLLLDIASAPGGIDFEAAAKRGLSAALMPSLPGKYAPRAAGEAIARVVQVILLEEEDAHEQ